MFHVKLYREIGRWNVLRGLRQRALPSGLPPLAGEASSADCARGLCPLDSRSSPEWRPMRTAPEGSALWTPAGAYAPDPEMLRISLSPAGGTGILKFPPFFHTMLTGPPKAGRAGRPIFLPPFTNILFS